MAIFNVLTTVDGMPLANSSEVTVGGRFIAYDPPHELDPEDKRIWRKVMWKVVIGKSMRPNADGEYEMLRGYVVVKERPMTEDEIAWAAPQIEAQRQSYEAWYASDERARL